MAAKGSNIGAGIVMDGEKEFKKALAEINAGLRVTASELALVTAQYSDNAASVKALTERGVVLENRISGQTEKIVKLRAALMESAKTLGESDTKTMKWQVSLNNAEAELAKMENELKQNNGQLQQAQKDMQKYGNAADEVADKTTGFGNKVADLAEALGIHLPAGADNAVRAMDGTKVSTLALVGVVAGLVTGFGKLTVETAKTADEILTLSKVTGLGTDTIQEMNYASELVDISAETMTGAMRKMIVSMDDAKDGSKEAKEAFKDLHVSITNNGKLKDSEQMFYEIVDALGQVTNETERDAISMKVFGKSAQELNPLIEAGSKALKEYGKQAQEMGYVMSGDTLDAFGRLDDSMQLFNNQTASFKNSIAVIMLPILTSFFELLNKIDPKILATVAIIGTIAVVGVTVVKAVGDIAGTFSAMNPAMLKTTAIVVGVTAALIILAAAIAVITGKGDELNRTMTAAGQSVGNMTNTVNSAGSQVRYSYASGIDYVPSDRIALIHKGERVQRADENPYNPDATLTGGGDGDLILNVHMDEVDEVYKLVGVARRARQKNRAGRVAMA
jgi:hypothetical protein